MQAVSGRPLHVRTSLRAPQPRRCLVVRSQGKVVREYREDNDQVVVPGASSSKPSSGDTLNVSEMKVKLPSKRLSKVLEAMPVPSMPHSQQSTGSATSGGSAMTTRKTPASKTPPVSTTDVLSSTWEHRAWTYGCFGLLAACFAHGCAEVSSPEEAAAAVGAMFSAYILADLGTGIYHWSVDNYGGAETPLFGRQIAAFQGHHREPWTITLREFANNLHQVCKPATPVSAALLAGSFFWSPPVSCSASFFLWLVCMSQQFHAWSHMKASELHPAVLVLQDAGLLVSRRMHGAHHKAPFASNYSIVSGITNPLLDQSNFFRHLENAVYGATGVEPRSWHEVTEEWAERVRT